MPHTVRLHRVVATKPEKIYRAFLEADALAKWLPPNGFTCTVHELNAKAGGRFKMPSQGAEIATFRKHIAAADGRHRSARYQRTDAWHRHQPFARRILLSQVRDLIGNLLDAIVEATPIRGQGLDNPDHARQEQADMPGENIGKRLTQTLDAFGHGNAAVEQEGADPVYCWLCVPFKPCPHPVQGL